jgi:hypothetical protein
MPEAGRSRTTLTVLHGCMAGIPGGAEYTEHFAPAIR